MYFGVTSAWLACVAGRVSARRPTHFLLLRQEKVSKEKASRRQGRCAVPCAARSGRVWRKLGFASNMRQPDPPAAALLSPVTTAVGAELRSLAFGIVNCRGNQQPNSPARNGPSASKARRDTTQPACKVSASERARDIRFPDPRTPAMETVPSSAGNPQGTVSGSPFLWVLSFGEAKESTSAAGPRPGLPRQQQHPTKKQCKAPAGAQPGLPRNH